MSRLINIIRCKSSPKIAINIVSLLDQKTYCSAFASPKMIVFSEPQSVEVCFGIPPSLRTSVSQRYATEMLSLLLGITHSPSHFLLNLSRTPQIAKPYLHSLSWPSQHQTSFGPAEVKGTLRSCCELGLRLTWATGSSAFWIFAIVFLQQTLVSTFEPGKWLTSSNEILF